MTTVTLRPGPVAGRLPAPSSKSYTHRALVAGFLSGHPYRIVHPLDADDTRATRDGLRALGSRVTLRRGSWTVAPLPGGPPRSPPSVRCGQSGTTLRLLTALAARTNSRVRFTGTRSLAARPMDPLFRALRTHGVQVRAPAGRSLPLTVGGPVQPGTFVVDGSVSSQFASALLFVLPTLDGPSSLRITGPRVSEPYIEATVAVIRAHRVDLRGRGSRWTTPGGQVYRGRRFEVPGDASSAAYLWGAAAVTGGSVTVSGIPSTWPQADLQVLEVLRDAGTTVRSTPRGVVVEGKATERFDCDLTGAPDLYPLLGAIAATIPHRSLLRGARHVLYKESDRRAATMALVRALGGTVRFGRTGLEVSGTASPRPLGLFGVKDHRVVMSAAVAALGAVGPSRLGDAASVTKSFPTFWASLREIGARVGVGR